MKKLLFFYFLIISSGVFGMKKDKYTLPKNAQTFQDTPPTIASIENDEHFIKLPESNLTWQFYRSVPQNDKEVSIKIVFYKGIYLKKFDYKDAAMPAGETLISATNKDSNIKASMPSYPHASHNKLNYLAVILGAGIGLYSMNKLTSYRKKQIV